MRKSMIRHSLRHHFPIFSPSDSNSEKGGWIYFDSAATSQKPQSVLDTIDRFYRTSNANVHRASHERARQTTAEFENVRQDVQRFINSRLSEEIVWTKGATESINLVANGLGEHYFKPGDRILLSTTEHHANIVPWQQLAQKKGLHLDVISIDEQGCWHTEEGLSLINDDTALVAIGHVSNALGNINPIDAFIQRARQFQALTLIDGAQATAHMKVDVQSLDCDFYVFSGHKMFAPTGIGVLYGKKALLDDMTPYQFGGEMIEKVSFKQSSFQSLPFKFEAGTPNIEGVLGLGAAVKFVVEHRDEICAIETALHQHLYQSLKGVEGIRIWGQGEQSAPVVSFTLDGIDNQDLGILLNQHNIAVRVGHHCAMPLMDALKISGTVRASLSCYNTLEEIDSFISVLKTLLHSLRSDSDRRCIEPPESLADITAGAYPLADNIRRQNSWDQIYRQVMLAGKALPRLPIELKVQDNEIHGCESQVWVVCQIDGEHLKLAGDSPSKIVRGLLAVMFEPLQALPCQQLADFNPQHYLDEIGLGRHLSVSRGNGLRAVVEKIKQVAQSGSKGTG